MKLWINSGHCRGRAMSDKNSDRGATRLGFCVILGGLTAGAILGTTVVARADDGKGSGSTAPTKPEARGARPGPADVRQIGRDDIDGLAAKLDAVKVSDSE